MGDPLPIAALHRSAYASTVQIREIQVETGVPAPHPFASRAGEVGLVQGGGTKTGRADHRAIGTRQTTLTDRVEAGMVWRFSNVLRLFPIDRAGHFSRRLQRNPFGHIPVFLGRGPMIQDGQALSTRLAAYFNQKTMGRKEFGQSEVKKSLRPRPGPHGCTKTRRCGYPAVHSHHKERPAAGTVHGIAVFTGGQNAVKDLDGRQITGAYSKNGKLRDRSRPVVQHPEAVVLSLHAKQGYLRRIEKFSPAVGSHRVAEQRIVSVLNESIVTGPLDIPLSPWKVLEAFYGCRNDGSSSLHRAPCFVGLLLEPSDQVIDRTRLDNGKSVLLGVQGIRMESTSCANVSDPLRTFGKENTPHNSVLVYSRSYRPATLVYNPVSNEKPAGNLRRAILSLLGAR